MQKFSEAFESAREAVDNGEFTGKVKDLKKGFKLLFTPHGPAVGEARSLDKLRDLIVSERKKLVSSKSGVTAAKAEAKVIITAAGAPLQLQKRAATLKMLKHLYHATSSGGQTIWVYSPPVAYTRWIFDELAGANATTLENVLSQPETEVYTEQQRKIMAAAVQLARAVTLKVAQKLGAASDTTLAVVRRYFGNSSTTNKQLLDICYTLASGYLKIANACNGGNIVISDEPGDRNNGGWKDWAFIYTSEAMSVIYLQGAWLAKADEVSPTNTAPLFRCARTVIHELSHKQCSTEDICYGPKGLVPSASLKPEYALHNADSWAYFAVDVLGYLTGPDAANGKTANTAILTTPKRTLTAV